MRFLISKTGISIIALVVVFVFLYFFTGAFGGTFIGLTLRSNPDLENGLVAHYTFDAETVNGFTVSDSGGSGNNGSIVATTTGSEAVADTQARQDGGYHYSSSPQSVWVSDQVGYIFYPDFDQRIVVASSTDGGVSWNEHDDVEIQDDNVRVAVWYDKWTPENESGSIIHVLSFDRGEDDLFYTQYDTSDDSVSTSISIGSFTPDIDILNYPSITKAVDGTIYAAMDDGGGGLVVACSSICTNATNWGTITGGYEVTGNDYSILLPIKESNNVILIWQDISADTIMFNVYSATSSSWWGAVTALVDIENESNDVRGGNIGATIDNSTGDIYVAYGEDINNFVSQDHDINVMKIDSENMATSSLTSVGTDFSGGIESIKIASDKNREGHLYVVYTRRTTIGDEYTGNIYYKASFDGGATWSGEMGPLNATEDELDGLGVNIMSDERLSVYWMYETGVLADDIYVATIADIGDYPEWKTVPGNIGQGMKFDGVDDYVDLGSTDLGSSQGTIAVWVKANFPQSQGCASYPILYFDSGDGGKHLELDYNGCSGIDTWRGEYAGNYETPLSVEGSEYISDSQFQQWQHVVFSWDSNDDELRMFVNGVFQGFETGSMNSWSGSSDHYIGYNSNGGDYFKGNIDDLRIYDSVLSTSTIMRLYELGATTKIAKTLDSNPDLENGLLVHYTFDGAYVYNVVENRADNTDNAYLDGAARATSSVIVRGIIGQAVNFDGVDDKIVSTNEYDLGGSDMTASVWFKADELDGEDVFSLRGSDKRQFDLMIYANGDINYNQYTDCNSAGVDLLGGKAEVGEWYHVAIRLEDSVERNVFVNGVKTATDATTDAIPSGCLTDLDMGGDNADFTGTMDDFRLYNRALSDDEILRLYELGATTKIAKTIDTNDDLKNGLVGHWSFDGAEVFTQVTDHSGSGNTGYLDANMPTTTAVVPGKIGQAFEFDGVDDYVDAGDIDELDALPVSGFAWVNIDELPSTGAVNYEIINKYEGGNRHFRLGITTAADELRFDQYGSDCDGSDDNYSPSEGTFTSEDVGSWVHVGFTWASDGALVFYMDGVKIDNTTVGTSVCNGSAPLTIGGNSIGADFKGKIDDVRVYDRVVTEAEVLRLYELGQ